MAVSLFYLLRSKFANYFAIEIILGSKTTINSDVMSLMSVFRCFLSSGLPTTDIERYELLSLLVL
jgi:hypothetical protein